MKLRLSCLALALIATMGNAIAADDKTSGAPIAKVNGVAIPAAVSDVLVAEQVAQGAPAGDNLKKAVKDELIRREVLAQEARKLGLEKKPEVNTRIAVARQSVVVGAYVENWIRAHQPKETDLRAEFDKRVAAMPAQEYHVRHILSDKEETAVEIIKKLQAGAKFAELAKDSLDTASQPNGGDLGWNTVQSFPPAFGQAIAKLEKGSFTTQPVATESGFHVILVEDSRKLEAPKFEQVRERLNQMMVQQALEQHINTLVKKAKVE